MRKKMSRYLAAILTSAMVLTGLSPTGVLAADVDTAIESTEAVGVEETAAIAETEGTQEAEAPAAEETVSGEAAESEASAVAETEVQAATEAVETEAPTEETGDEIDPVGVVTDLKVEIGIKGATNEKTSAEVAFQNYFPELKNGTEMKDFVWPIPDDPDQTLMFQEVSAEDAQGGKGAYLKYVTQAEAPEVIDGVSFPAYVQYTENASAGSSGLGNNNEPMTVGDTWKTPTQGALVVHPKADATLKFVGTMGSANRGMSVLKVKDDAEDKSQSEVHYSKTMSGKIETVAVPLDAGYTYYVIGNGSKIKFYSIAVGYPEFVDWEKDVAAPTLDAPVIGEDGSVSITWHAKIGDYEEEYKGRTSYWKYADYIVVELHARSKIGRYYKAGDLIGEAQTYSSVAEEGTMVFNPPYSGDYYFKATIARANGQTKPVKENTDLIDYILPLKAPEGINYNCLGMDSNGTTAGISFGWGTFDEANNYKVYYKKKGAAEWTEWKTYESTETTGNLTGLEPDTDYVLAVTTIRNNTITGQTEESTGVLSLNEDEPVAKENANPVNIHPTRYATKNWGDSNGHPIGFGTGSNKDPYVGIDELLKVKGQLKGLWYEGTPYTEDGHGLKASKEGGLFTMASEGNTGKVQDSTHDGLFFYGTTIDPKTENFTLSANVTLDRWDGGTGQEGFGLAALDRIPSKVNINNDEDGDDWWNNEYLVGCTKIQYYWDPDIVNPDGTKGAITTANPSDDNNIFMKGMRIGPGIVEKTGITKAMIDAKLTTAQMGQNLTRTWYSLDDAAGRAETDPTLAPSGTTINDTAVNLCGNIYKTEYKDGVLTKKYLGPGSEGYSGKAATYNDASNFTNFDISIRRHNSGYTMKITAYEEKGGILVPMETHEETCWFPNTGDPLLRADPNNIFVGFYTARNAQMTVNSYELTITRPDNDTPVERTYPKVDPNYRVVSDLASTKSAYTYQFLPNAAGRYYVERVTPDESVKGGFKHTGWVGPSTGRLVSQDETASMGATLKKGDNYFRYTFVPTNPKIKDPSAASDKWNDNYYYEGTNKDSAYYQVSDSYVPAATENLLKSYYPAQNVVNVKYGVLKTTKAELTVDGKKKSVGKVVYVSPEGGEMKPDGTFDADGTKTKPYSLQSALNFALPGYTILMMEGTYSPKASQEPFEVYSKVSGTQPSHIVLQPDPDAKTRPLIDVKGDVYTDNEGFVLAGSFWEIRGFDITNSPEGEEGLHVGGDNNLIENMNLYRNRGSGCQVSRIGVGGRPSNNTLRNVSSFLNQDQSDADADGFGMKLTIGEGNICEGCVAALNTDDGWDLYAKEAEIGAVTIRNCVAFLNGFKYVDGNLMASGNGNGFKLGGNSLPGKHRLVNSVAFLNKAKGIDSNHCPDVIVTNCTSLNNGAYNVNLETSSWESTNFFINGLISYRTENCYTNETLSGNAIQNWAYLVRNDADYLEKKFGPAVEDFIELKTPQKNGSDPAVFSDVNYYSFGSYTEGRSFHNMTKTTSSTDVENVDEAWFENLDWQAAVNGFIYYTQQDLGAAHPGTENGKYGENVFGLQVEQPADNKGFRRLPNGTLDFGGFMALKKEFKDTKGKDGKTIPGALLPTTHDEADATDKALSPEKAIKATGIKVTLDKDATKAANNNVLVSPTLMREGDKVIYTANVTPLNSNLYNSLKWYSANEDVAVVNTRIDSVQDPKSKAWYEKYTLTITGISEGKARIFGENGNGLKTKISVKVIQNEWDLISGLVTKPSMSAKSVRLNSADLVPASFKITHGINRTVQSVTLLTFKRGKRNQLTAAQVQNFFELTYDPGTCVATITMTPSDTDYGTDELGKRTYKTTDDEGYARTGKYKGSIRVLTKDADGNEIPYDFNFKIFVRHRVDQEPVMSLIQTADLSKKPLSANELYGANQDTVSGNVAYASYRILADKPIAADTMISEAVTIVSDAQESEVEKLPEKQRPSMMRYKYFQKAHWDPEQNVVTMALVNSLDGKDKNAILKTVHVYVNYEDGTRGYTRLSVATMKKAPAIGSGSLKASYSTGGGINVVSRGTTRAILNLGKLKVDSIEMDETDAYSANFGIREADRAKNLFEIYALEDSVLEVGSQTVKVKINGTSTPVKVRILFAPGKVKPDPKSVNLNLNSESTVVFTGKMDTNKWDGEVAVFGKDIPNTRDNGGRDRILLRKGSYNVAVMNKETGKKDKIALNVGNDILVSDIINESISYDEVELSVASLSDSLITKKLGIKPNGLKTNADESADLTDEHTRQIMQAFYQKMPKQAIIQYTVAFGGQNTADAKQKKRLINEKIILKQK